MPERAVKRAMDQPRFVGDPRDLRGLKMRHSMHRIGCELDTRHQGACEGDNLGDPYVGATGMGDMHIVCPCPDCVNT